MPIIEPFNFVYAGIVAFGGIVGYLKAGSVPSLGAGLLFGGLLAYGAKQINDDPKNMYLFLGTSTMLTLLMGYRYVNGANFMPAGVVATISACMAAKTALQLTGHTRVTGAD